MKIGIVLSQPPVYSESFLLFKIQGLLKDGFDVELFVDFRDKQFRLCRQNSLPPNFTVAIIQFIKLITTKPGRLLKFITLELSDGKSIIKTLKHIYGSLHILNSRNVEHVHFGFLTMSIGRGNSAKAIGARMSASIRGYDISRYTLRHPDAYQTIWKKLDKLHYISDALLVKAKKHGLTERADLQLVKITPAIDTSTFNSSGKALPSDNVLTFLTIARLHWTKGLEYAIEAVAALKKSGVKFKYVIVGDGIELERLKYACFQLDLMDEVVFAGKRDHFEIHEYYRNCDIYIQYSIQEGFCNAVLEAQAMGIPCIVSDAEGLPENVLNGETGWVIPANNPGLLSKEILKVLSLPPSVLKEITSKARSRIHSEFSYEIQKEKFKTFFSK